jgi:hypothetical protein
MTTDDPIRRALTTLAEADASTRAPSHIERTVLDDFDRQMARGDLRRWIAAAWAYRQEGVAVAVAVSVTLTLYFKGFDYRVGRSRPSVPPVQSLASVPPPPQPTLGPREALQPLAAPASVSPRPSRRSRALKFPQAQPAFVQTARARSESDDFVQAVRVSLPRAMLPLLGVPIIEPDAAGTVNVEVLLGNDGLARAIRVIR